MTTTKFYQLNTHFRKKINFGLLTDIILTLLIFFIMIVIILSPKQFTDGTISGLKLFIFSVLPGLFPFMLLTKLLTELGSLFKFCKKLDRVSYRLFGTPGISFYAFFMSILSGYPIGAKIISDLYEKNLISEDDAKRMSIFCTTSGPIFVIGTVGTIMFGNYTFGIILYVSHIFSSFLMGVIFNIFTKNKRNFNKNRENLQFSKRDNILGYCVSETVNSIFIVGAYITVFYLLTELFECLHLFAVIENLISKILLLFGINSVYAEGISYGILEVTRGAKALSLIGNKTAVIFASGILSFSGLSIIFQSMAFLKKAKIKTHKFIFAKFVHFIFSMLICYVLTIIII